MTRSRRTRGFSTAEVLVGSALSLVVLSAVSSFFRAQQSAHAVTTAYSQSQTVTRTVVDLMTRELRMATYDPSGAALTLSGPPNCPGVRQGIVEATPTRIRFKQDLDGNGATTGTAEDVTYDVSGTQIRRTDGANAAQPIVDNVPTNGLKLQYFDSANPPNELVPAGNPAALTAAQRDCVAKVRVTITANVTNPNPRISTPLASTAESEVAIRNRSLSNF